MKKRKYEMLIQLFKLTLQGRFVQIQQESWPDEFNVSKQNCPLYELRGQEKTTKDTKDAQGALILEPLKNGIKRVINGTL